MPLVLRVDGHRHVAEHGLRPRRGDADPARAVCQGIPDPPQRSLLVPGYGLLVGQGGIAAGTPVDDAISPVDHLLFEKRDEYRENRPGKPLVHGETLALPVTGATQFLQLADDRAAILLAPFPHFFHEPITSDLLPVDAPFREHPFHDHVRGDTGVIRSRHPEGFETLHPLEPDEHVLDRVVQNVAEVEYPGDVGWGYDDGIGGLAGSRIGVEELVLFPESVPLPFNGSGVVLRGQSLGHIGCISLSYRQLQNRTGYGMAVIRPDTGQERLRPPTGWYLETSTVKTPASKYRPAVGLSIEFDRYGRA